MSKPLVIGTITAWGTIKAVGLVGGERYYWIMKCYRCGDVAMMPASVVEGRPLRGREYEAREG